MAFADRLACAVVKDGHEHASFCEGDVATIRSHRLDFILQFGFGALQGEICVPRPTASGLLTMTMSGGSGVPTCFWDVMRREPTTKAALRRLTEEPDRDAVLHTAIFPTEWSFFRTYDQVRSGRPKAAYTSARPSMSATDGPSSFPCQAELSLHVGSRAISSSSLPCLARR